MGDRTLDYSALGILFFYTHYHVWNNYHEFRMEDFFGLSG